MDAAGAALRDAASIFGTGEAKLLADDPQQRSVRITVELTTRAVDVKRDGHAKLLGSREGAPKPRSVVRIWARRPRPRPTRRSRRRAAPACRARARGFRRASSPSAPA